jgi:hypothetical protein
MLIFFFHIFRLQIFRNAYFRFFYCLFIIQFRWITIIFLIKLILFILIYHSLNVFLLIISCGCDLLFSIFILVEFSLIYSFLWFCLRRKYICRSIFFIFNLIILSVSLNAIFSWFLWFFLTFIQLLSRLIIRLTV